MLSLGEAGHEVQPTLEERGALEVVVDPAYLSETPLKAVLTPEKDQLLGGLFVLSSLPICCHSFCKINKNQFLEK